jgi:hypothetical protein
MKSGGSLDPKEHQMTNNLNDPTEARLKLLENGYHPVPVTDPKPGDDQAGKKPTLTNWQTVCQTADSSEIKSWKQRRSENNTGILSGKTVGFDVDVLHVEAAADIKAMLISNLGLTPPIRYGQKPKYLMVLATDTPFKKKTTAEFIFPDGSTGRVEVLGKGQQFIVDGIHPKTLEPYYWEDRSVLDFQQNDLPCHDEAFFDGILKECEEIFSLHGAILKSELLKREDVGHKIANIDSDKVDLEIIEQAMDHIQNNDVDYDTWFRLGAALKSGLGDQGFEIFDTWSQQSSKYDQKTTARTWRHLKSDGAITIATLFWMAHQNGWRKSNYEDNRPTILVTGGALPEIVDQSEEALVASGIEIFQRDGQLVRPTKVRIDNDGGSRGEYIKFNMVVEETLSELFMRSARYEKQSKEGDRIPIDIPPRIANTYIARQGGWRLPVIKGVIYCPILREDGSIIDKAGYDASTGIYAAFDGDEFLPISETVSLADAQNALSR